MFKKMVVKSEQSIAGAIKHESSRGTVKKVWNIDIKEEKSTSCDFYYHLEPWDLITN